MEETSYTYPYLIESGKHKFVIDDVQQESTRTQVISPILMVNPSMFSLIEVIETELIVFLKKTI